SASSLFPRGRSAALRAKGIHPKRDHLEQSSTVYMLRPGWTDRDLAAASSSGGPETPFGVGHSPNTSVLGPAFRRSTSSGNTKAPTPRFASCAAPDVTFAFCGRS